MNLLTVGAEYKGSMGLFGCGVYSANLVESKIKEKFGDKIVNCVSLRGENCTSSNIISSIKELISNKRKTIIYYAGHGDHHMVDKKYIEYWNTPSGQVDQIKLGNILSEISDNSFVVLLSESCSSEHMINPTAMKKHFISIGATQDYEDAMMTCDGGLFSVALIETLKSLEENFTVSEFISSLSTRMIEVEHFSVRYSDGFLLSEIMF